MKLHHFDAYIPQVRPHNQRRDYKLFFMISRRPLLDLSSEEVLLYDSIDGRSSVADLEKLHPGAPERLMRWYEASIIELSPPLMQPASPHLVVIEPHMDDAALSVGGRLLHRRGQSRITILTVVKWSNFTSYLTQGRDFLDVKKITDLRQAESVLVAKLFGAEHQCLDWSDAPLRFWPAERWSCATAECFKRMPQVFTNHVPRPAEVSMLAKQLSDRLRLLEPDELWIPMGLGNHVDHRTTRNACLQLLTERQNQFSNLRVFMYEEVPYAATVGHAAQIRRALAGCGARLLPINEDITDVLEEKLRVVSVYASQFKRSYIDPGIRAIAAREAGAEGEFAETCHQIKDLRRLPPEASLSREWAGLTALRGEVAALMRARDRYTGLTVVALPSGHLGNWENDTKVLVATFPDVNFRVYAPEGVAWQISECGNDALKPAFVRRNWRAWARVLWREFFRFGTPTIVLWRGAYASAPMSTRKKVVNGLIKLLLPFRRLLLARSLWDFCTIVSEQTRPMEDSLQGVALGNSAYQDSGAFRC